jgi:hypothetical protein
VYLLAAERKSGGARRTKAQDKLEIRRSLNLENWIL